MGRERNAWRPGPDDQTDGVRVREFGTGPRIEIDFRFKGVRCRECLKNLELTPGNWKYAIRRRGEVLNAIARDTFNYGDFFPDSPRAAIFGHARSAASVEQLLTRWFKFCEAASEKRGKPTRSTLKGYRKIVFGILVPEFGTFRAVDLAPAHIKEFILKQDATAKTIRNVLSPLRLALDDAVDDGVINTNPLLRLNVRKQIEKVARESDFEIDPFDLQERQALLEACRNEEEQDQYIFWFETGLRPGEMIGAEWPKVDWIHSKIRIDIALVEHQEKGPKTDAGVRDVDLTPAALAALTRQKARTFLAGGRIWRVPFPLAGGPNRGDQGAWESDAQVRRVSWYPLLKRSGVRHRNMYQVRHTFASTHASRGANLFWLAAQMGHETIEMIIRHYARWIPGLGEKTTPAAAAPLEKNGHVAVTQQTGAKILSMKPRR